MPNNTFATQEGKAYYYNTIPGFINDDSGSILSQLINHAFEIDVSTRDAWTNQISELKTRLSACGMKGDIIFEYDIKRLGKRIDVVLLIKHMVFSLEFKNGKKIYTAQDAQQAEDYALDIKNFHKESENLYVCPILIATDAPKYKKPQETGCYPDRQIYLQRENIETLIPKLQKITDLYGEDTDIDFFKWFNSPYHPTPTIIAAAVEAYSTHDITQIAHSEAGQENITKCEKSIEEVIDYAKSNNKKCVCFVTGVPGAGKTLVGLNVAAKNLAEDRKNDSVYVSGNGPLVEVLREALHKSAKQRGVATTETKEAIRALIQKSFDFIKEYASSTSNIPPDNILIFDEAQRVWNKNKMMKKHKNDPNFECSEPKLLYSIMDRKKDWSVMICLVGLGQDIYDGEVGVYEWFRCGIEYYKDWELFYSSKIFNQTEDNNIDAEKIKKCSRCHVMDELHLNTSIRSFRADKQSKFIDALLNNNPELAKIIYTEIAENYPIFITRDINNAKNWAREQIRGSQRCGVLASSGAQRLKPEGIFVPKDLDVKNWFLAPSDDIRSSNMMENVASEFKVQGLEIDWGVVCWDADLRRNENGWDYYQFKGTKWNKRRKEEQIRYLINTYRVLLTRARQGMIIFVSKGVDSQIDPTRSKEYYDGVYNYLVSCGIKEL